MIRINLLPIKEDRKKEALRNQLLLGGLALAVEFLLFFFFYTRAVSQNNEQKNRNEKIKNEVAILQKEVANHQSILDEIAEFEKRQEAINRLIDGRQGPVFVLLELSNILSKGGRPYINHDQYQEMIRLDPNAAYDENWDFRRVWLKSFKEKNRRVTISGDALTHEDVAEFLRRLNLSSFFVESELISTSLSKPKLDAPAAKLDNVPAVVSFELKATIKYR